MSTKISTLVQRTENIIKRKNNTITQYYTSCFFREINFRIKKKLRVIDIGKTR